MLRFLTATLVALLAGGALLPVDAPVEAQASQLRLNEPVDFKLPQGCPLWFRAGDSPVRL